MDINRTGLWGEIYAARFLRDNGFDLIAGNYRRRVGEIDIIAEKDGVTCFIEVKTRGEDPMFRPMEAVDGYKRERLKAAAALYLKDIAQEKTSRFDVVEVTLGKTYDPVSINYSENAF